MTKRKAIILEDEAFASRRLKRMIKEVANDIEIIATYEYIADLQEHFQKGKVIPDVIFMDIQVADGNSLEASKSMNLKSYIIFTTAYDQYAIQAFRQNALDYLMKPIKMEELAEAINRIPLKGEDQTIDSPYNQRLLTRMGSKFHSISVDEIAYIHSKNKISYVYTTTGDRYASDDNMYDIEAKLDPNQFFRANRQFIIHIDAIANMKRHDASRLIITLQPPIDEELVVSTEKTRMLKEWIKR